MKPIKTITKKFIIIITSITVALLLCRCSYKITRIPISDRIHWKWSCQMLADVGYRTAKNLDYPARYVRGIAYTGKLHVQAQYNDYYQGGWKWITPEITVADGEQDFWFTPQDVSYDGITWEPWKE